MARQHHADRLRRVVACVLFMLPGWVLAESDLQEIVVTAQKREQSIQDVGISMTAIGATQLRALGVTSTEGLENQTPGVMIAEYGGGSATTSVNIRGVSQLDFADHQESPNALFVDGAYVSFIGGVGVSMFDMDRVEVLRGPQGTLFGRNSTGGLIQLISKKPTQAFESYVDLTYSSFNRIHTEAAVSGPFSDTVRGRLSVSSNHQDGYFKNLNGGPDLGGDATANVRAQLEFDLTGSLNLLLNVRYSNTDNAIVGAYHQVGAAPNPANHGLVEQVTEANRVALLNPLCSYLLGVPVETAPHASDCFGDTELRNPWSAAPDRVGRFNRELPGFTSTLKWSLSDAISLTSLSDYQKIHKTWSDDSDQTPQAIALYDQFFEANQFSQELRLNGKHGPVDWVLGAYYLNIHSNGAQRVRLPLADLDFNFELNHRTSSWAVFSQSELAITERLSVITGARWTEDDKKFDLLNDCHDTNAFGLGSTCAFDGIAVNTRNIGQLSGGDWSGKAQVDYHPSADVLLYAGVTRGTKAGSVNATVGASAGVDVASLLIKPEVLVDYEAGFKSTWLDGRVRVNGSVFYYDYKDYQAFTFKGLSPSIFNANAIEHGGELEVATNPLKRLDVNVGLALLRSAIKNITLPDGTVADQEMPYAPHMTVNGLVRYSWTLLGGTLAADTDFNYGTHRYLNSINEPVLSDGAFFMEDVHLTYTNPDDRWDVSLYADNVTNALRLINASELASTGGWASYSYSEPRTFGIRFGYRWK